MAVKLFSAFFIILLTLFIIRIFANIKNSLKNSITINYHY
jgi:hypothetical protein